MTVAWRYSKLSNVMTTEQTLVNAPFLATPLQPECQEDCKPGSVGFLAADAVEETRVLSRISESEGTTQPLEDERNRILQSMFWERVDRSAGPTVCWPFTGPLDKDGYGIAGHGGKRAHRVAFALANQREPVLPVLHRCDNRPCCQPLHLYEGTQAQNIADRDQRGRTARGERNGRYKQGLYVGGLHHPMEVQI